MRREAALYQLSIEFLHSWESARIVKWLRHRTSNPVSRDRSSQGSKIHTADGGQQTSNSCPVFPDFSSVHRFIWLSMNYSFQNNPSPSQTDQPSGTNKEPPMPEFVPLDVVAVEVIHLAARGTAVFGQRGKRLRYISCRVNFCKGESQLAYSSG